MRRAGRRHVSSTVILAVLCALLLWVIPFAASAQTATSSLLVKLATGLSPEQQAEVIARNGGLEISSIPALRLHVIQVAPADLPQVLPWYRADPQVVHAEENKTRKSQAFPADPLYPNQWSLPKIGWDLVFGNVTPTGSAIVAILDTGVDATHPDLESNVVPGTSILDGSNGMSDPNGHGTWMAGIVAAQTNTVMPEGIAGVAYTGVRMMPVTVLDANGLGQDSDVIAGVIWAADHGADVIVMAFSNPGFSQNLQDALDYAWSKNVVLVAATGNDALSTPTFPAGDRGVMGVAGTDPNDTLVPFSNYGPSVFIAAPGTDIQTTAIGDAYTIISGTSGSAAIVAGAAAFMRAVDPTLSNGVIVGRLARMADPAGTQIQTGNGRINMARALADTGTDFIQPAGAPPVGGGGPFVGPYVAATKTLTINFTGTGGGTVNVTGTSGTTVSPGSCTATCGVTTSSPGNSNNGTGTLTATANSDSSFVSFSGASPGVTCTGSTCNFSMTGSSQSVTVTFNSKVTQFKVEAAGGGNIATQTAGTPFNIKITAQDASNNTITGFTGQVTISSTGALSAGSGTTANFVAGVLASHSVTISNTGTFTIAAAGQAPNTAATGTSIAFDVNAGALAKFVIGTISSPQTAGAAFSITITAPGADSHPAASFVGTVDLITTAGTITPAISGTFSSGVRAPGGAGAPAGTRETLTVTRTGGSETGTRKTVTVDAAAGRTLTVLQQPPATVAGVSISPAVKVQAKDAFGNNVPSASVAMALTTGTGTLSGAAPQLTDASGVATFGN